jgi:signal transduction histidine kinase
MATDSRFQPLRRALLYLGAWTLLGLFNASQALLAGTLSGQPADLRRAFLYQLTDAWTWALLALVAIALARRFPFGPHRWALALAVHVPAALTLGVLQVLFSTPIIRALGLIRLTGISSEALLTRILVGKLHGNLSMYALVVGVVHAFAWYRRSRDRELASSRLEASLQQARLQALRAQLQPHFLFNTLHAISSLMHSDVERADRMLARLSDLLRLSMERADRQEVPLREELEFLEGYLDIQQTRFGDRLRAHVMVAPETLDAMVPVLVLQPLVENAIRHGISDRVAGGRVEVVARRDRDRLRLDVSDDGVGPPPNGVREGTGLTNTRARLAQLYGAAQGLELAGVSGGGTRVRVSLPFRIAEAAA